MQYTETGADGKVGVPVQKHVVERGGERKLENVTTPLQQMEEEHARVKVQHTRTALLICDVKVGLQLMFRVMVAVRCSFTRRMWGKGGRGRGEGEVLLSI